MSSQRCKSPAAAPTRQQLLQSLTELLSETLENSQNRLGSMQPTLILESVAGQWLVDRWETLESDKNAGERQQNNTQKNHCSHVVNFHQFILSLAVQMHFYHIYFNLFSHFLKQKYQKLFFCLFVFLEKQPLTKARRKSLLRKKKILLWKASN